ncbi:MAG: TlpA family protein disulfide reductase [Bacteroidetes bacterium]|nr:MAG: TlpA family protein disulfide reductase [Bacteroidota bacterium]
MLSNKIQIPQGSHHWIRIVRLLSFLLILSIVTGKVCGQKTAALTPLHRGDRVPDFMFTEVYNYSRDTIRLSDFRGKLVILDFWGPACYSCIKTFPFVDSLQKKFKDQIQIILVGVQTKDSTDRFFRLRKRVTKPSVPFITKEKKLFKLMSVQGVPFHVWIDEKGIIKYMAESHSTTARNIEAYLKHKNPPIPDRIPNVYIPSFFDKRWQSSLRYYTYLSEWNGQIHIETPDNNDGVIFKGLAAQTPENLYQIAFNHLDKDKRVFDRPGRTLVQFDNKADVGSFTKKRYNYQMMIPENVKTDIYELLREDLDRIFQCEARIEKKEVKCFVLTRTGPLDKIISKGGPIKKTFRYQSITTTDNDSLRYYLNLPFAGFSERLKSLLEDNVKVPYIDSVNYDGNVDIVMKAETLDYPSIEKLQTELKRYGLLLEEKMCMLDVLVIKKK